MEAVGGGWGDEFDWLCKEFLMGQKLPIYRPLRLLEEQ